MSGGSNNHDWATATKCVSLLGHILPLWTIFKGILNLDKWHITIKCLGQEKSGYYIAISLNGWTDNKLGVKWFKKHF